MLDKLLPNFDGIILGWPPFKIVKKSIHLITGYHGNQEEKLYQRQKIQILDKWSAMLCIIWICYIDFK